MSQERVPDAQVRASDADRERIVELLRQHTAEGRLTMDEFEERMTAAYAAKTYGELGPLTADLPVDLGTLPRAQRSGGGAGRTDGARPGRRAPFRPGYTADGAERHPAEAAIDLASAVAGAAMDLRRQHSALREHRSAVREQRFAMREQVRDVRHQGRTGRRLGRRAAAAAAVASWISLSVLLSGIWVIQAVTESHVPPFWPIWPIGILGILLVVRGVRSLGGRG